MITARPPAAAPAWIPLSDPDIAQADLDSLMAAACSTSLSHGPRAEAFEEVFAKRIGRRGFLYLVHLGTRFSKSGCDAIIEDLRRERIDAYVFSRPLHTQRHYIDLGEANRRGKLPATERLADRAVALPFHSHLSEEQAAFIVSTLKDASVNVGAGSAIYL